MAAPTQPEHIFPKIYYYPPFFSIQPNALTRASQFQCWSSFILAYCQHHRLFKLILVDALESPLFNNVKMKRHLNANDARDVIDYMVSKNGNERAEWIGSDKATAWIWWRKPEEWASLVEQWVDETGQKNTVLTLYELTEGEATEKQEFHGLDMVVLQKSLNTLVKRGRAQVFGDEDRRGVKFF